MSLPPRWQPQPEPGSGDPLYATLVADGSGDRFDRHVFACLLAIAWHDRSRLPTETLGLSFAALEGITDRFFPRTGRRLLASLPETAAVGSDAVEEPDLRRLLLDHRSAGRIEEFWLAHAIARRSLAPNHLWQDLGLFCRADLSHLMSRHFRPLAERNTGNMKWKKFFYRELCQREGVLVCKAPTCDVCCDVVLCFGDEAGEPLARFQEPLLQSRQNHRRV